MQPEIAGHADGFEVSVNGRRVGTRAATLDALLAERGFVLARGEFACAVNGCFVPRPGWSAQRLAAGDCVDIVAPVVGG